MADFHNFKVVRKNVQIDINGFNSSKRISTKIVKVPFVIGNKTYEQDVICIDQIRTKFCVDGVGKLVTAFLRLGLIFSQKIVQVHEDPRG